MRKTLLYIIGILHLVSYSETLENIKLTQDIDLATIHAISSSLSISNKNTIIRDQSTKNDVVTSVASNSVYGITFDIYEDGVFNINFDTKDDDRDPLERILVNGVTLSDLIKQRVGSKLSDSGIASVSNIIQEMVYNPLWGKKLCVIGDSLTVRPSLDTCWPAIIANRNNMVLNNQGIGGQSLCKGSATIPALINSYSNAIPTGANAPDFILCQIGTNDSDSRWMLDSESEPIVSDTDMTTNTFKGCFNLLLIGLKTRYPQSKLGIILPNNWGYNIGSNSQDVVRNQRLANMSLWMKTQCQKLNIPVFDPVEDTRWMTFRYKLYPCTQDAQPTDAELDWEDRMKKMLGTAYGYGYSTYFNGLLFPPHYMFDEVHTSERGNKLLSHFYEFWMKTVLMCN